MIKRIPLLLCINMAVGRDMTIFTGEAYCIINPVVTNIKQSIPFTECHKRSQNGYEFIRLAIFMQFSIAWQKKQMSENDKQQGDKQYYADYI